MIGLLVFFIKRALPELVQQVLNDVGGQFSDIFEKPNVKRAMSVLGTQSGEVRASDALKNKVADKIMNKNILLKKGLEYLDITPVEGLELMNDPTIGPIIQGFIAQATQGLMKVGQGGSGTGQLP